MPIRKASFAQGFSLFELLIAITIIAIIATVGFVSLGAIQKNSRDAQRQSDLRSIQSALQQYYADNSFFPDTLPEITNGNPLTNCSGQGCAGSKTYLSKTPKDPNSPTTNYCYTSLPTATTVTGTDDCSDGSPDKCHFYELCAKFEGTSGSAACACSGTWNFRVTPL